MIDPIPQYRIRYATNQDVSAVIGLRAHAEMWLHAAGIDQWTVRSTGERNIRDSIAAGTTYVVTTGAGDVIGSLAMDAADLDFWTPAEAAQPAMYLYKFMIGSDRRGSGLGEVLLDWCCARAELLGARWLRLDCWRTNAALHRYYLRRGFRHVATRQAPGRQSGALFERPVDTRTAANPPKVNLIDETVPLFERPKPVGTDRYDPIGEAAIWQEASNVVEGMRHQPLPSPDWSAALDQAARTLDCRARAIRQAQGMYYRVIDGQR